MKRYLFVLSLFCAFCISCNNDDDNTLASQEGEVEMAEVGFYNLRVGNTWTYEYFEREEFADESSEFITTDTTEEREIIEQTDVNGEIIYTLQVTTTGTDNSSFNEFEEGVTTYQVKDSLGYLVRLDSRLIFSNQNNEEYLKNPEVLAGVFGILLDFNQSIEVPAGVFDCSLNEFFVRLDSDSEIPPGREMSFFASEIGEVLYEYSFVSQDFHIAERRLISFDFPE